MNRQRHLVELEIEIVVEGMTYGYTARVYGEAPTEWDERRGDTQEQAITYAKSAALERVAQLDAIPDVVRFRIEGVE